MIKFALKNGIDISSENYKADFAHSIIIGRNHWHLMNNSIVQQVIDNNDCIEYIAVREGNIELLKDKSILPEAIRNLPYNRETLVSRIILKDRLEIAQYLSVTKDEIGNSKTILRPKILNYYYSRDEINQLFKQPFVIADSDLCKTIIYLINNGYMVSFIPSIRYIHYRILEVLPRNFQLDFLNLMRKWLRSSSHYTYSPYTLKLLLERIPNDNLTNNDILRIHEYVVDDDGPDEYIQEWIKQYLNN